MEMSINKLQRISNPISWSLESRIILLLSALGAIMKVYFGEYNPLAVL